MLVDLPKRHLSGTWEAVLYSFQTDRQTAGAF